MEQKIPMLIAEQAQEIKLLGERYKYLERAVGKIADSLERISNVLNETMRPQFNQIEDHRVKLEALTKIAEAQSKSIAKIERVQERQGLWIKSTAAVVLVVALASLPPAVSNLIGAVLKALAL